MVIVLYVSYKRLGICEVQVGRWYLGWRVIVFQSEERLVTRVEFCSGPRGVGLRNMRENMCVEGERGIGMRERERER